MAYSSIQVTTRMRRRLARYKLPSTSYEDVLEVLLDAVPPAAFRARMLEARKEAAARLLPRAEAAAREARSGEATRLAQLTAGQRMEEAFRLSALGRGRA